MIEKPRVSVVIPTLNREAPLRNTVAELLAAPSRHMEELIVIDQSDAVNDTLANTADPRLIYRHVDFKSLPNARNFGTSLARGDLVLFLDDDVTALTNIVDAHARAHLRTGADLITGPALLPGEKPIALATLSPEEVTHLRRGRTRFFNLDSEYIPMFAVGCNSCYRKSTLESLGGFDENFRGSPFGDDSEMSHRLVHAGGRIVYDPEASLIHLNIQTGGCRDEADLMRRAEANILHVHYLHYKTGHKWWAFPGMLAIIRTQTLNRRSLKVNSINTSARQIIRLLGACVRAHFRTARLLPTAARFPPVRHRT